MPTEDGKRTGPGDDLKAYVQRVMVCDCCGAPYTTDDVQVVLHRDSQWELTATCSACSAERAVTAYDEPPYSQLRSGPPVVPSEVTQDEVAAWASYLAEFDGDIFDLLT
jgi:hypothetical protein